MPTAYILVGVPGSGKSTWIKNQDWSSKCVIASTDDYVEAYARSVNRTYSEVFDEYMPKAVRLMMDRVNWARENNIRLMLAGHTHGGQIQLPILGPVYSPSRFGCRFASGVFWLDPTLMYVSRGISGKEPIRYNCRPEVTQLKLLRSVEDQAPASVRS